MAIITSPPAVFNTNVVIASQNTGLVPFTVQGAAGQATDLQQWRDNTGAVLLNVTAAGVLDTAAATRAPSLNNLLPAQSGATSGQVLGSDGANASWVNPPAGGAGNPAGSSGQVQYNSSGVFGGAAGLTWTPGNANNLIIDSGATGAIPLTVRGISGQVSNLQNWSNDTNQVQASISSTGVITVASGARSSTLNNFLPDQSTANGKVLTSSSGTAIWGSGISLPGAATQIVYNDDGVNPGGNPAFTWSKTTGILAVGQLSGTPGTTELQISHDGTNASLNNKKSGGAILFPYPTSIKIADSASGAYWNIRQNSSTPFTTYSGGGFAWSSTGGAEGSPDTVFQRVAPNVVAVGAGAGTYNGWFQNAAGLRRMTALATNATTTMSNLSDLSITLIAGRKYAGLMHLFVKNSTAAEGLKVDFNGGTATFTNIQFALVAAPGATLGTIYSAAAATAVTVSSLGVTTDICVSISFSCVCNAGGTLIPRFAENTHSSGTATVELGSFFRLEDSWN